MSGGQAGAQNGALTVMVGGDQAPFDKAKPVIDNYARMATLIGPSGAGQLTKMVNQAIVAVTVQGVSEGLAFAQKAGLDIPKVMETISKGAAQSWQMDNRWKTMNEGKFDFGFAVDWMRKDLGIIMDEAKRNGAKHGGRGADRHLLRRRAEDGRQPLGHLQPDRAAEQEVAVIVGPVIEHPAQPVTAIGSLRSVMASPGLTPLSGAGGLTAAQLGQRLRRIDVGEDGVGAEIDLAHVVGVGGQQPLGAGVAVELQHLRESKRAATAPGCRAGPACVGTTMASPGSAANAAIRRSRCARRDLRHVAQQHQRPVARRPAPPRSRP